MPPLVSAVVPAAAPAAAPVLTSDAKEQLRTLGLQLQQRDNEIATLVVMLQGQKGGGEAWTQTDGADGCVRQCFYLFIF
jgi:hypothetical protein